MVVNNPISKLDAHESWQLLSQVRLGRVCAGQQSTPDIHPVSYLVHAGKIYFRTGQSSRLLAEIAGHAVAFEAAWQEVDNAWSVVVHGDANAVDSDKRAELDALPILDFAGSIVDTWVEIVPSDIRGRRFHLL